MQYFFQIDLEPVEWSKLIIPADSEISRSIHTMSYTLSGLSPSTVYEASVLSRNRFGWSRPSHVFRFSTLGGGKMILKYVQENQLLLDLKNTNSFTFNFLIGIILN